MSLLERLQDMLGLGEAYPYRDEFDYVDGQVVSHGGETAYTQSKISGRAGVVQDNVIEMPGMSSLQSELVVMEPRSFEEIPEAILALRDRKTVILNLTNMDPAQAQRSVDYVAGGVFGLEGHQERIGPNVFLFTPNTVHINSHSSAPAGLPLAQTGFQAPFTSVPASPSLADRLSVKPKSAPPPPASNPPF
ncbi:MAG: cell division protein SepF [Elainellaceae cyanobacterium]